jgi:hypothetical protein
MFAGVPLGETVEAPPKRADDQALPSGTRCFKIRRSSTPLLEFIHDCVLVAYVIVCSIWRSLRENRYKSRFVFVAYVFSH